ncbi:TPA: elongation factor Ts [Candidatus Scatousia excrementigallinarum]|uniref:Elongation factor Ts n=1 Tax=Candidatus Scatousia excrementigallinarum TaxID=2840935 RepID=A0A9D1JPN9_9BACT|nr:elongation factor Ts [Candidatus Scatousia excrementigallinarum]
MNITAQMVKELRDKTGAGMMDAKKALVETDGDMEKAMEVLRQKGMASADKKMGRIAAEGLIATSIQADCGAMVEVNCETDFVAKNDEFKELTANLAEFVAKENPADVDALLASTCPQCGKVIADIIKEKIASIGEKITFRRFIRYEGNTASYVHNGKIGVLIKTDKKDEELMNDICLHIASSAPEFISREEIPQSVIDHETEVEMGKEDLQKKPEAIRAKIVEGRVNKLMASRVLLEQPFIKNPDVTVGQLIEGKMKVESFTRYMLGEGLEKRQENFADEVMNQIKG